MEANRLVENSSVRQRVTSCFKPRTFATSNFRSSVMGTLIGVSFAEVTIYMLLRNSALAGQIPFYVADVLLICISIIELLLAPFVSWVGFWRPRKMLILWHIVLIVCVTPMMMISVPSDQSETGSDLCASSNVSVVHGLSAKSIVSLIVLIVMAISCVVVRIGVWSHGIAYLDEQEPNRMGLHFSILAMARVLATLLVQYIIREMIPNRVWLHTLSIIMPCLLNLIMLLIFRMLPSEDEPFKRSDNGRGYFNTLGRVITNKLAVVQMVGIALLTNGLWGFAFYDHDIVKAKYHILPGLTMETNMPYILTLKIFVVFAVIMFGFQHSAPMMPELCILYGLKRNVKLAIILGALYLALALTKCQKVPMAGLSTELYIQPPCSQSCGCTMAGSQFNPICDTDSMISYMSPCHAGCSTNVTVNGVKSYTNCSCAVGSSRMLPGACNVPSCQFSLRLHQFLFILVIVVTILGFQSQGAVMVRVLDPRDKAVGFGVLSAIIALFAPIGGHSIYVYIISGKNCAWYDGGRCLLQNSQFPVAIGAVCASLVFLSAVISLVTFFILRRQKGRDPKPVNYEE